MAEIEVDAVPEEHDLQVEPELSPAAEFALEQAAELLAQAERPVVVAGHGVLMANATDELPPLCRGQRRACRHHVARAGRVPRDSTRRRSEWSACTAPCRRTWPCTMPI